VVAVVVVVMASVTGMVVVIVRAMVVARTWHIVFAIGGAAVVPLLGLTHQMVLLIALALVRWAVALATGIVVTAAHHRVVAMVLAVVLYAMNLMLVFVAHLVPRLLVSSKI
jgi:hypothetical protein